MQHPIKLVRRKQRFQLLRVANVQRQKMEPSSPRQRLQSRLLQLWVVVSVQVVDANHFNAATQQPDSGVHAAKASRTCDKYFH